MKMRMLLGAVVLVAVVVVAASLTRPPTYEASALLAVKKELSEGKKPLIPLAPTPEDRQALTQATIMATNTSPVAREAIRRLGLEVSPGELLQDLTLRQVETSQFIRLTYTDTDPARAQQVVNTVGQVSSERVSVTIGENDMTATLYDKASMPEIPASPKPWRNGLITLVVGLVLIGVVATVRGDLRPV
jgi:capsular polysaccharide biosynthesis protein